MKKFKIIFATVILGIATVGGFQSYEYANMTTSETLLLENVEALAQEEDDEAKAKKACSDKKGSYNMASICVASGFERVECTISGAISAFGVSISGSYKKGDEYNIPWARYECKKSDGNCCTKQGLYTGDRKLA